MKRKLALALMLVLMLLMLVPFEALAQEIVDDNIVIASYASPSVRKSVQALDLLWSFYVDTDSAVKFITSSDDGVTWSSATTVRTGVITTYSSELSVYVGGSSSAHIHITYATATTTCYYRRGTLYADGTITWLAEQLYPFVGVYVQVAADSNGYPWIGGGNDGTGGSSIYITKSSTNNGNWSTEAGYKRLLDSMAAGGFAFHGSCIPVPLTDGKLVAIWQYGWLNIDSAIKAQRYDGVNWGSVKTSTLNSFYGYMSIVGQDDDAHIVALERTTNDIEYMKYSYSLSDPFTDYTTIYSAATTSSSPVISRDSANNLHVFWENDPTDDHVYYAVYNYDESTWYSYYDLVDEIDDLPAMGYYLNTDYTCDRENLGVYYIAGTTTLKFKLVDEPFIVDTLTPTPLGNTYATLRGEIMSLGFGSATERGFLFNTSPTDIGAWLEGNETGTFNVGVFTHGITGLLAAHTYWYVAYASGDYGTSYGNWTSFYTTSPPAPTPPAGNVTGDSATICSTTVWNFLAQPVTNTDIKLTWDWWPVSGNSSTQIAIYYGLYYYPIDLADGTLIYQGTGDAYTHTNLNPGTTYYYRAWLLCGGNYSADYVQDWATTYGSSPVVSPPEQPEGWFQDPSCTAYSKIPLLSDALVAVTTAYGFPATTVCVMFTLLWIIVLGLAVFLFIHSAMMMIITIAVLIILASIMGLLPLWMIVIAICLGGISIYISGRT